MTVHAKEGLYYLQNQSQSTPAYLKEAEASFVSNIAYFSTTSSRHVLLSICV